jgi:hypothetical protein
MFNEDKILRDGIGDFRLLTEWVNRNDIVDAIQNRDVVYIYYSGDKTVNRGFRTIEPHVLGKSTAGNLVLRAWQQAGATDSGRPAKRTNDEIAGWRLFRLDGITTFMKTMKHFVVNQNNVHPNYNPEDSQMSEIIIAINPAQDLDIEIKGTDSAQQPDVISKKVNMLDPQAAKFKSFYDAAKNKDQLLKKTVGDLYNYIKLSQKKDPLRYIVVNKNGRIWYDKATNEPKYNPADVLGNLNNLFRKLYDVRQFKVDKKFIEQERQKFIDTLKKAS